MNPDFWRGRRVLVTGHTGFKGSWLALWLGRLGAAVTGYALHPPTDPSLFALANVGATMHSVEADVRELAHLRAAVQDAAPEIVIHLAAQSLVRMSYTDPAGTFSTNVMGTINLLEACRGTENLRALVVVTSDKCYEEDAARMPYRESDPLGGHDPYSASKACAEIATASYRQAIFGGSELKTAIATVRAGNVIGGGDWAADRLMTDLVNAFCRGARPRLRNPRATRPWQHVLDPLAGYLALAERLYADGQRYAGPWNFGPAPDSTAAVQTVADGVARLWGAGAAWELDTAAQPREAPLLALDATKARERLGWRPLLDLDAALDWTVAWYKRWHAGESARALAEEQIQRYMGMPQP